ncbi:autotransporter outer membrane beta-barrel domain-containing protein [Phascolarctobacterium sp.]
MHSKKRLAKQVLHTVMAMSIVYSSGLSILVPKAGATELFGVITGSDTEFSIQGLAGEKYIDDSGIAPTAGSSVNLQGVISDANISNDIVYNAVGGTGGDGALKYGDAYEYIIGGGAGGDVNLGITIKEGLQEVTVNNITVKATGGIAGSSYKLGSVAGAVAAYGIQVKDDIKINAAAITVEGKGADSVADRSEDGGLSGGNAAATGIKSSGGTVILSSDLKVLAQSGKALGAGYAAVDIGRSGKAISVGIEHADGDLDLTVADVIITAEGGTAGKGHTSYTNGGDGSIGGAAEAYGFTAVAGTLEATAKDITISAVAGSGGDGGNSDFVGGGGNNISSGGNAGNGAGALAYGIKNAGAAVTVTAEKIDVTAQGGNGGNGGQILSDTHVNNGGDGGDGADASAYGAKAAGGITNINADTFKVTATAGTGGNGSVGTKGGTAGNDGSAGKLAEAYGVYAEGGATVNLSGKDTDTISLNITAAGGADSNVSYAIHAADSTVNFLSNATITGAASETWLENAALGFSGSSAGRTVTSDGALKLNGSNTFRFSTDLKNNTADKFTFGELAAGSSTEKQYITVGYDKSFSGSDLSSITGTAVVLSFGELNGYDLSSFEGKASTMDSPLKRFTVTPTVEADGNDVKITQLDFGGSPDGNDASETSMTSADTHLALRNIWRAEGNNLMKRMGELRSDPEVAEGGVWARYYRGELSADSAYDRSFSQDYTAFQGGIDKVQDYKGGKLYTGIAINRIDSNAAYFAGSGDLSSTGVGVYASWLGSKGHYLDVIARGSKLANDFKLVDMSSNAAKADYDTWAYGISAEYGYRQNLNAGWFVEPQAELSLGHINSVDYMVSNGVNVRQDSVNSAVTRVGILGGKEFTVGGRPSNAYLKASLLHDFGGNGGAAGYYGTDSLALQAGDLTGTWYEIGLGANLGLAKNSNLYFDALKTFNGNIRTDWQINAGLRFTF